MPHTPSQLDSEHANPLAQSPPRSAEGGTAEFVRGCRLGIPIFLGYAPVGAAFGVLARSVGFTVWEAGLCSATALAGAGQFIALSILQSGAGAVSALIATTVVNLRYVLFATTLSAEIPRTRLPLLSWLGFTLTDETFAVNIADIRDRRASSISMAGVGFVSWLGWLLGTLVGALAAGSIGDPARFGVGFAMPAMFAALFVALAEDRRHVVVGVVAGMIALALPLMATLGLQISRSWFVVIAAVGAATLASVVIRDS